MKKIVILLSAMLFMVACEKRKRRNERSKKVVVSVYDENGKIATGVPVKMYNEKDYKVFEKDNLTFANCNHTDK